MTTERTTPLAWRPNLTLFVATVVSVFVTGTQYGSGEPWSQQAVRSGLAFAGSLLSILVAHELGHFVASRLHRVDASLPYFIPMPFLSPFGTMGAVIRMREAITTRKALLDIGASGPLAGLVLAIPLYAWGAAHSAVVPIAQEGTWQLGESILLKLLDRAFGPTVPAGHELLLSPVAFGAWGGMFVTMINLIPVGQLDGGHVAYALFGPKQDHYAQQIHRAMLGFFVLTVAAHAGRDILAGLGLTHLGRHLGNATFWLVWFQLLAIVGLLGAKSRGDAPSPEALTVRARIVATLSLVVIASFARDSGKTLVVVAFFAALTLLLAMERKGGVLRNHRLLEHPPTGAASLDTRRRFIAVFTLVVFVLLFMPEPMSM